MNETKHFVQILPRYGWVPFVIVWVTMVLLIVHSILSDELTSADPPPLSDLLFGVFYFGLSIGTLTVWFFAIPALMLFNVCVPARRARFGRMILEYGIVYIVVTGFGVAALLFVQATYPAA